MKEQKFVLGVWSTVYHNQQSGKTDFKLKIEVTSDIIDWLEMHDVEYSSSRHKRYVVNNVKYVLIDENIEYYS